MLDQEPAPNQTNKAQEATVRPVTLLKAAEPNPKTARLTGARLQISQFRQPDRSESTRPSRGHRPRCGARQLQPVNKVPGYHFTPLGRQKNPSCRMESRTEHTWLGLQSFKAGAIKITMADLSTKLMISTPLSGNAIRSPSGAPSPTGKTNAQIEPEPLLRLEISTQSVFD